MPSPTVSDRKINANRSNALKSTGPKTPEGKARSAQNARRHSIFCKDLLVPGEDPVALEEFKLDMLRSLNPRTVVELQLVEQIIADEWRIKRIRAAERAAFERQAIRNRTTPDVTGHAIWEQTVYDYESKCKPGEAPSPEVHPSGWLAYLAAKNGLEVCEYVVRTTPGAVLDRLMRGQELDRLSKYEQRLRNSIFRAMKELRLLRNQTQEDPSELTAGLIEAAEEAREAEVKNEATATATPEPTMASAPEMPAANLADRPTKLVEPGHDAKVSEHHHENLPPKPSATS